MSEPVPRRLILFAKPPLRGRVKTRLARDIGERAATAAYRDLLEDTLERLAAVPVDSLQICASGRRHPSLASLARRSGAGYRLQGPGDLGQRMQRAAACALDEGYRPVIVGADCAGVTAGHVEDAFAALDDGADAVFAPAEDGGYALIGLARPLPAIFQRMPWGTSAVMARSRRRLRAGGHRWHELAGAWDVDDLRDLRRWRRERAAGWRR